MSTFSKVIIILGTVFIVLGIICSIIAVSVGGVFNRNNNQPPITMAVNETYSNVNALSFDISASEVIIKSGSEFKIEATDVLKDHFESYVENGEWIIKDKARYFFSFFSVNGFNFTNYSPKIVIYLPESFVAEHANINLGAGSLKAEILTARSTKLGVGAGEIIVNNIDTSNIDINCGAGSIEVSGMIKGDNKVNCGVGKIALNLKGNESDYSYNVNVGIGSVKINDSNYGGTSNKNIQNQNAENSFRLDCGVGEINLQIKEN